MLLQDGYMSAQSLCGELLQSTECLCSCTLPASIKSISKWIQADPKHLHYFWKIRRLHLITHE